MLSVKIHLTLWSVILLLLAVTAVLHPRIHNILPAAVCAVEIVLLTKKLKGKDNAHGWKLCLQNSFAGIVCFGVVWYIGQFFNLLCPYHAVYEYKSEIAELKADYPQEYSHFPDEIPDGASKVEWRRMPGFMQGSGSDTLFFYADNEYLAAARDSLAGKYGVYTYSVEGKTWQNKDGEKLSDIIPYLPFYVGADTEMFLLYDNEDWNHRHVRAVFLNMSDGYICCLTA